MTLTTRLSYFFLTMLAIVLLGFSVSLYQIVSIYLNRQVQEQLQSISNALRSAVEIGENDLEWEPNTRIFNFDSPGTGANYAWIISDENGNVVERSQNKTYRTVLLSDSIAALSQDHQAHKKWQSDGWLIAQTWVKPPKEIAIQDASATAPNQIPNRYRALLVTAGVSTSSTRTTLNHLIVTLFVILAGVWSIALAASRYVCRRALLPVTQMAENAREINTHDLSQRLMEVITRDELGDLNRSFNDLLNRVQESFERQRKFTSDASHQLRTPLTVIQGQIEVALRRERSGEDYQEVLEKVLQKATGMTQIVESLLFLARTDTDAARPHLEEIRLNEWLPQYLSTWSEHERFNDIIFNPKTSEAFIVSASPALMRELLNILLDNACKYSPSATPITISVERSEKEIMIHVIDRGHGIKPSDIPNLFVPFFRSEDTIRQGIEGVGLGLSIAKRIAASIGAELTVTSQLEQETSFNIVFVDLASS